MAEGGEKGAAEGQGESLNLDAAFVIPVSACGW